MWLVWTAIGILLLLVEISTPNLVTIWFVPSAVITAIVSLVVDSIYLQVVLFVALSAVCLALSKKVYKRIKKTEEVNPNDRLIGTTAKVVETVSQSDGKVLIGDVYWRAICDEQVDIGEVVVVKEINGTTLVVSKNN
jgi:membrane protein implicated in regulation of membrane protease activity